MARKPFVPKEMAPGDVIVWTQERPGFAPVERIGTVWSGAPAVAGQKTVWVVPDDDGAGDTYKAAVPVVRVSRDRFRFGGQWSGGRAYRKGEYVSSAALNSETEALSRTAYRVGQATRAANAGQPAAVDPRCTACGTSGKNFYGRPCAFCAGTGYETEVEVAA